jgi:hypothetical protein
VVPTNGENALNKADVRCFVCGGIVIERRKNDYRSCINCGHETLVSTRKQNFIINDYLSKKEIYRITSLDRFKTKTLVFFDNTINRMQLLDIGSASGKFLYHNAGRYIRAMGIEITPASVKFSRQVLGLDIIEDIHKAPEEISFASAWHVLEHIPEQHLLSLLKGLSGKMSSGARLLVSVPNCTSWQYRCFGRTFAYYDVPNHLHQFTPESLERLLKRYGFQKVGTVRSWPYNIFGYTQSLLNIITQSHNYLYYRLKRRNRRPSVPLDLANGLLLIFAIPVSLALGMVDAINLKRQGVITTCFEKSNC